MRYTHLFYSLAIFLSFGLNAGTYESDKIRACCTRYEQAFDSEYRQIISGFLSLCGGLTWADWQAHCARCVSGHAAEEKQEMTTLQCSSRLVDPCIVALANKVFAQAKIGRKIAVLGDESSPFDLYVLQSALMVNERAIRAMYPDEKHLEAVLWHEAAHLAFDDAFIGYCINNLYEQYHRSVRDVEAWNRLVHQWDLFKERRADILGVLRCPAHIHARLDSLQYIMDRFDTSADEDHPPIQDRYAMIAAIARELQA